jgi:hypothetical protein
MYDGQLQKFFNMFEEPLKPKKPSFAFQFSLCEYIKYFVVTVVALGATAFWICTFLRFYSLEYQLTAVHPQHKFDASLVAPAIKNDKVRVSHSLFGPCFLKIHAPMSVEEVDIPDLLSCSPSGHSFTMVAAGEYWISCSCRFVQVKASRSGPPSIERQCCCHQYGKEPPAPYAYHSTLPRCHINELNSGEFASLDGVVEVEPVKSDGSFLEEAGKVIVGDQNRQQRVVDILYEFKVESFVKADL